MSAVAAVLQFSGVHECSEVGVPRPTLLRWLTRGRPRGRSAPRTPVPVGRVVLRADVVALARGEVNIRRLAAVMGVSYSTLHFLLRHPQRVEAISLDMLAKLCAALDCQPGDLLSYSPPASWQVPSQLPDRGDEHDQLIVSW
jgi:putative transcriptional regulator